MAWTRKALKIYQRDVALKNKYEGTNHSYVTQCPNHIFIAIKFYYDIPKGCLDMECTKIVLKINKTDIIPKLSKGGATIPVWDMMS